MLADKDAFATIAVRDAKAAKKFYEDVLGLQPVPTGEQRVLSYNSGDSSILVYESRYARTNKATAATRGRRRRRRERRARPQEQGSYLRHYDSPDTTRLGEEHVSGKNRAAWFKDPVGNILSLVNG